MIIPLSLALGACANVGSWIALDPAAPKTATSTVETGVTPVAADHQWAGRVAVAPLVGMPPRITSSLNAVTTAVEVEAALQSAFRTGGMAAADPATAPYVLTTTYRLVRVPFKIGLDSEGTATFHYALRPGAGGAALFEREITTRFGASGGEATARVSGVGRIAVRANLASAVSCLARAGQSKPLDGCEVRATGDFERPVYGPIFVMC